MTDYDSPWKVALEGYFEAFLAFLFPAVHAAVEWSHGVEFLDKELQQVVREGESGRLYVDKLVKVWLNDGREGWILIHVEVQTRAESEFARRMYEYHYRLFDRYNRKVLSLAVLADNKPAWRPERFGYDLLGCALDFRFPTAKLLDYARDWQALERHANPFAIVVLAHLKCLETRQEPGERLSWKARLVKALYERGVSAADLDKLFRFIDWTMDLPEELEKAFWSEIHAHQEEKRMPYISTPERIGLRQGRREGIECLLEAKFGEEGLRLMAEVHLISKLDSLRTLLDHAKTATSLDEFRQQMTALKALEDAPPDNA